MSRKTDPVPDPGVAAVRRLVDLSIGALVTREETVYRIEHVLDSTSLVGVEVETGRSAALAVAELQPFVGTDDRPGHDLGEIADERWHEAQRKYAAVRPFVHEGLAGRKAVEARAAEVGVGSATLYRWIRLCRHGGGTASALIEDAKRGWPEGRSRLSPRTDRVIEEVLDGFYLDLQRPTVQQAINEIQHLCHERGIEPPSPFTVRRRVRKIKEKELLNRRGFKELAAKRFTPTPHKFPNMDYPLAVVQIDHSPADVVIVDDVHRKPIGRPWLTVALDLHTRMIAGYYLSLDQPSAASVGLCLTHAALPKEHWLARHGIDAQWPVWGFPKTVHVDNGADFRSKTFERACGEYGIHLEFRPVKQPHFGGHVERVIGTINRATHALPGATFASVPDRGEYDSEKYAALTRNEYETWLVSYIAETYHRRKHGELGMTPLRMWEIGIHGNAEVDGIGLPKRPADPLTVELDFMPRIDRTIQPTGVTIDGCRYFSDALRPWTGARDRTSGKPRQFLFRRDPRNIKTIWFYDPDVGRYFAVPFSDTTLPSISLWEYREVRARLKLEGDASVDSVALLRAISRQRSRVAESVEKTKKARKASQRRADHENKPSPAKVAQDAPEDGQEIEPAKARHGATLEVGFVDGDLGDLGDLE